MANTHCCPTIQGEKGSYKASEAYKRELNFGAELKISRPGQNSFPDFLVHLRNETRPLFLRRCSRDEDAVENSFTAPELSKLKL